MWAVMVEVGAPCRDQLAGMAEVVEPLVQNPPSSAAKRAQTDTANRL